MVECRLDSLEMLILILGIMSLKHIVLVPGRTDLSSSIFPSFSFLPPVQGTNLFVHRNVYCSAVAFAFNVPKPRIFLFSPLIVLSFYLPNAMNSEYLADRMGKKI